MLFLAVVPGGFFFFFFLKGEERKGVYDAIGKKILESLHLRLFIALSF